MTAFLQETEWLLFWPQRESSLGSNKQPSAWNSGALLTQLCVTISVQQRKEQLVNFFIAAEHYF